MKEVETPPKGSPKLKKKEEQIRIINHIRGLTGEMTQFLTEKMSRSYFFSVIQTSAAVSLVSLGPSVSTTTWVSLGRSLKADAFLRVRVEGYGHIKRSWMIYLLGSGMIEGLVQGIAVSFAVGPHQQWIAAGVGAEEALQETVEWLGGAYLFDRFFTPVILKGELISAKTGKVFWKKTVMNTRDSADLKKLPKKDRAKKEFRLKVVADAALKDIARSAEKAAAKNEKFR